MARRATFIREERNKSPYVLLVDAGNALSAGPGVVSDTKGKAMIEGMNLLGYDAMTLGDQDFMWGADTLQQRMSDAKFAFLSANVFLGGAETLFGKAYVTKEMAGHQVTIIGATNRNLVNFLPQGSPQAVLASEPIEAVRKIVEQVRTGGGVIIVSSNLGLETDQQLAAAVPGITAIVGGNPGTLMTEPYRDPKNGTLIVQAGYQGEWIGKLTLDIDGTGKVTNSAAEAVPLTESYADDPEVRTFLDGLSTP